MQDNSLLLLSWDSNSSILIFFMPRSSPHSLGSVEVHGVVPIFLGLSVFLSCFSIRGSKWSFCFHLPFLWEMLKKGSNCSGTASLGSQMADEGAGGNSGAQSRQLAGCTPGFLGFIKSGFLACPLHCRAPALQACCKPEHWKWRNQVWLPCSPHNNTCLWYLASSENCVLILIICYL